MASGTGLTASLQKFKVSRSLLLTYGCERACACTSGCKVALLLTPAVGILGGSKRGEDQHHHAVGYALVQFLCMHCMCTVHRTRLSSVDHNSDTLLCTPTSRFMYDKFDTTYQVGVASSRDP